MYALIQNENYGYAVATHGPYVGVGNPRLARYGTVTPIMIETGSVDVFKYDQNTDTHLFVETLYKPYLPKDPVLLAQETGSSVAPLANLHTEAGGYDFASRDKDIQVDEGVYFFPLDNDYGRSLDWYNSRLAVGCSYYWDQLRIGTHVFDNSGSCVDIWDYTYKDRNQYTYNSQLVKVGWGLTGSGAPPNSQYGDSSSLSLGNYNLATTQVNYEKLQVPPGYDQVWVYASVLGGPYSLVSRMSVPPEGGYVTYAWPASTPAITTAYQGVITDPTYLFRIENPDSAYSSSFGRSVSMAKDWLAIGSPQVSQSKGMVYLYKNQCTGSQLSWSLYQKLSPSSLTAGQQFGWDLALNKSATFIQPNRLVVGCGSPTNNTVYLFELSGSSWVETYDFHQDTSTLAPLTFNSEIAPLLLTSSYKSSSFGTSVGIWENTVVIGAPTERVIQEYSGSPQFQQGTAYIFERCANSGQVTPAYYQLSQKVYGNSDTLKNNRFGYSVSLYGNNLLVGIPKRDVNVMSSSYLVGSLTQQLYCNTDLENTLQGQWMYLTRDTSSMQWEVAKVYQKKKKFLTPYRSLGEDVCVGDMSIVVGAPMTIADPNRAFLLPYTASLGIEMDDLTGKAYIYNLKNYKTNFYVGNVFYRNGILVVNTSGSAFDGLFFNATSPYSYEYALDYKSRHTIHEKQVVCTVEPGEFNVSTNPTALVPINSPFDVNQNGEFDFQDADILLRYMQYKNSVMLGNASFDWSSSIVSGDDEISLYNYNAAQWQNTDFLFSSSLKTFENTNTNYASLLDFNQDNRIDINDMGILWKYFSHRLTEKNYLSLINSQCQRQQVSTAITYLDSLSQRNAVPQISPEFSGYEDKCAADPTGSFLAPMVTTVGLYDGLDLVAVAKLGTPIKLPKSLPINFVVKMDF